MADLNRIKNNVSKMVSMGAPEKDIDAYIQGEGTSIDEIKNFNQQSSTEQVQSPISQSDFSYNENLKFSPLYNLMKLSKIAEGGQPGVQKQGALGQIFNVPGAAVRSAIQGNGYAEGAMNPDQVPKFQDMIKNSMAGNNNPALNLPIGPGGTDLKTMAGAVGGAADMITDPTQMLAMLIGAKPAQAVVSGEALKNEKIAGNIINSLIKPAHKQYLFGKNPGLGVAKEGLTANSLDELGFKVEKRLSELKDGTQLIRNTSENINKTVNLENITQPLIDSYTELNLAPATHSAQINNIKNALTDLKSLNNGNLSNISISDAYKIKDVVGKMQNWTIESKGGNDLNTALRKVYHIVDSKIDKQIPELEKINSRMANLISAKQAIKNRIEVLSKQEGMPTLGKLLDLPFHALKTPTAKTTLGKLLSKQYEKIIP